MKKVTGISTITVVCSCKGDVPFDIVLNGQLVSFKQLCYMTECYTKGGS